MIEIYMAITSMLILSILFWYKRDIVMLYVYNTKDTQKEVALIWAIFTTELWLLSLFIIKHFMNMEILETSFNVLVLFIFGCIQFIFFYYGFISLYLLKKRQ